MNARRNVRIAVTALSRTMLPFRPRRRGGTILCYHHVIPEDAVENPFEPSMCIGERTFEKHLLWCREAWDIVPLRHLLECVENGQDTSGKVAITFDDGWEDFYSVAYPLLKRHKAASTLFVSTSFIGTRAPIWFSTVVKIAAACRGKDDLSAWIEKVTEMEFGGCGQVQKVKPGVHFREGRYARVLESLKGVHPETTEKMVAAWTDAIRRELPGFEVGEAWMDWDQIREMDGSGWVDFAPHGDRHWFLGSIDEGEKEREIRVSQAKLRGAVTNYLNCFSYPGGIFGKQDQALLRRLGIPFAVTYFRGAILPHINPLALPRTGMHDYYDHRVLFQGALG